MRKGYCLFGLILFFCIYQVSLAQITIFPEMERRTDESVQIIKIEIDDIFTIIDFVYVNLEEDVWICADKNFYIQPSNSNERKYMIMAKEITLCPDRIKLNADDEDFEFQLYFPAIDTSLRKIDVIEKPVSGFNFFGVWLDKSDLRPEPDSLEYADRTEFENFFNGRLERLRPLEGIWELTTVQSHYHGDVFMDNLEEEPENLDIAIIWTEDHYECYTMDGKSIESGFYDIAEGGRYAYKEYYREIKEEVTSFVHASEDGIIEHSFIVPQRWAKYLLHGKIY
ncbi:MAG: hypothetical protein JSV24_11150, partial [Bacteroidales bacterium]